MSDRRRFTQLFILSIILLFLFSCSSGGGSSTTPAPSSPVSLIGITVTATSTSVAKGTSLQFTAAGNYADNTSKDITASVTWSSSDSTKASVDNFGRVTAVAAGTATITATSDGISGSGSLTVTTATLVSMTVTPASPSIAKGTSQQFSVIGIYSDNTLQNLTTQATWSSSDATKATINNSGVASGVTAGTVTITATSGTVSATAFLTITNASLASLSVTPTNATVPMAGTTQLSAKGSFSDGTTQDLTTQVSWSSSDATKATVNTHGVVTGVAAGSVTITATSGNISSAVTVAVSNPNAGSVQLSGTVQPDPADPTAKGGQSGATVYVVGQQSNAVTTDSNGNFTLNVNPSLSGTVLAKPNLLSKAYASLSSLVTEQTLSYGIIVVDATGAHGVKSECLIVTDQANNCQTLYINTVGSISGHAYLQGQSDNSGITVYIPGTSFSAITAADGSYKISGVPSGTYDFVRAEKFGTTYHYAISSNVTVATNQDTAIGDMILQLSVGAFGNVLINNGAGFTNNKDVTLSLAPSSDAVLMSVSSDPTFVGAQWVPVQSTYPFSFPSPYPAGGQTVNVYVKFAQDNGLASDPTTTSIYLDTNPQATKIAPASVTMSQTPTLQWSYAPPMLNPKYHVQLTTSGDTNFATPIVDQNNVSSAQYTVPSTLNQGSYIWRVAIIYNGTQLGWVAPWPFTVDRSAGTLSSPTNTIISNTTPQFTWLANPSAIKYSFTLSTNLDLSSPITTVSNIVGNSYTLLSPLSAPTPGTLYYWAITPYDSLGNPGTQSAPGSFTLDTVAPSGSILINDGDTFTAMRNVSLALSATDGTGVAAYYVSENGSLPSSPSWVSVFPSTSISVPALSFALSATSGIKTVNVWYMDQAGNIGGPFSDTINLINMNDNVATIDSGGVGRYPSIAVGVYNSAAIVYTDLQNTGVKFITNEPGSWVAPIYIDAPTITNSPWSESNRSITYAPSYPFSMHTVYSDSTGLRHGYKYNIAQAQWTSDLIDASGGELWTASIASAATGTPWAYVSYQGSGGTLNYATNTSGSWVTTVVDNSAGINAMYTSIALDPDNTHVHISYYDGNTMAGTGNKVLKYATNKTGVWVYGDVVDSSSSDVGWFSSIAVDSANIHIAYYDKTNGSIKYATKPLSGGSWTTTTVDNDSSIGSYSYNWTPISLAVDKTTTTNNVFISYPTWASNYGVKLATNYFGSWATAFVDRYSYPTNQINPIDTSIAVIGGSPVRVYVTYFDNTGEVLKYTSGQY